MTNDKKKHADIDKMTFEQAQSELEGIVEKLEDPQTGLDQALELWERGEHLHSHCQKRLDYAAQKIEKIQVGSDEPVASQSGSGDEPTSDTIF